jgi:hypothetical protein
MNFNTTPNAPKEEQEVPFPNEWKKVGESFIFVSSEGVEKSVRILKVLRAQELAASHGLNLERNIPAYVLEKPFRQARGAYHEGVDAIFLLEALRGDEITVRHEIVHAIEMKKEISEELEAFFEKVKATFPEGIERDGISFRNFRKNVHEFLADGYTHPLLIATLEEQGLYDEFLSVTSYLKIKK